jgi:hypothetical protein
VETSQCIYEIHVKHAKEELIKQIKDLKSKDHLTEQIFSALSSDDQVPEILQRLRNGETYQAIVEWLGRAPLDDFDATSPRTSVHSNSAMEGSDQEMMGTKTADNSKNRHIIHWTTVTDNEVIADHLFQLFFAWVHPVHTLFSEGHFTDSYKNHKRGQYCSAILVNAICAMGCHLHTGLGTDQLAVEQLQTGFMTALWSDIDPSDRNLTTIQAFAIMFLIDCARGQGLRASTYLKVAAEGLSNVAVIDLDDFSDVLKVTSRGIECLNV